MQIAKHVVGSRGAWDRAQPRPRRQHLGRCPSHPGWRLALSRRSALSLIEVVMSTLIVGVMAVAALNSLGAAMRSASSTGNRAVALGLAEELMMEILQQPYSDPDQTPTLGRESGEPLGPRAAFDDLDDYHGWNQSPPQYPDGTPMPDRDDWRHHVEVVYVNPTNPTQTILADQGAKRITVTIEYNDQVLVELSAVSTDLPEAVP